VAGHMQYHGVIVAPVIITVNPATVFL